jgi:hypothetical protein
MQPPRRPTDRRDRLDGAASAPFSRAWLRAFEPLVVGTEVPALPAATRCAQLVCSDGDRVRPWLVELAAGRVVAVSSRLCADAGVVVAHSITVGWRLLGLSVRGFHRLDELVVEQLVGERWARHPLPPLDEGLIDLTLGSADLLWHERVIDSPLGTLFVRRGLVDGRLRLLGASTKPPPPSDAVATDIAWPDVMALRRPGTGADAVARRAWRGREAEIAAVQQALARSPVAPKVSRHRDRSLLEVLAVLRAMRVVLRGDAGWRELWRPSASRPPV